MIEILLKMLIRVIGVLIIVTIVNSNYGCQGEQKSSVKTKELQIVNDILTARKTQTKIPPVSTTFSPLSVEEAYQVQDLLLEELVKEFGPIAGYKIGYATAGALKKNKIDVPAYGPLFQSQIVENRGKIPAKGFSTFSIENEITFKVGRTVDKHFNSLTDLIPYVESIHLGFDMSEVVFDGRSSIQDFIADGAGSKYFMVGDGQSPDQVNVDDIMLSIDFKNSVVYEGSSKNVLGNPWNVMLTVSNDLFKRGRPLKKGHLIFSGKAAPAYMVDLEEATGIYTGNGGTFAPVICDVQ